MVAIIGGANVIDLVDRAALGTAVEWAVAGHLFMLCLLKCHPEPSDLWFRPRGTERNKGPTYREPGHDVGVGGIACTTGILLIAGGTDHYGIFQGSWRVAVQHVLVLEYGHSRFAFLSSLHPGIQPAAPLCSCSLLPFLLASRGLISNTSTPSIFPRISRRSRPVDCSRSVGTVPSGAPGPSRSSSVFISVKKEEKKRLSQQSKIHPIRFILTTSGTCDSARPLPPEKTHRSAS